MLIERIKRSLPPSLHFLIPRKMDAYILAEVSAPFLGGVFFFIFVFLMFQALRLADFVIVHGMPTAIVAKLVGLLVISFLPISLPIAFLIAVLVGFGRLSADSELVAFKASGVSIYRMSAPVCFLALVIMLFSLILNLDWVPRGNHIFKSTLMKISNTKVVGAIREGTFTTGFFNLLIFADKVDAKKNTMKRVFIFNEREANNPMTIVAKEGELVPIKTEGELSTAIMLKLYSGSIHKNEGSAETYQKIDFDEYQIFLENREGIDNSTIKPKRLTYAQLREKMEKNVPDSSTYRESRTELWRRYSVAMTPLLFVFLGIGFGTIRTRSIKSGAALITFVVILIYYSIQGWSTGEAYGGRIHPILAMQLPNLFVLIAAALSFRKSLW